MIAAPLAQWKDYFAGPTWEKAFTFLEQLPSDSPDNDGLVPIQGEDLLYRVMTYPTRGPQDGIVEAHDRYVDIQMSLDGTEAIDWFDRDSLTVKTPYKPEIDVILFERPASVTGTVINAPHYFSVYFPEDAHMAQQIAGTGPETVRKVVIKVRKDLVRGAVGAH